MIQLSTSDMASDRRSVTTWPMREYFTLASTGYIISSRPMAMGSETVPIFTRSS